MFPQRLHFQERYEFLRVVRLRGLLVPKVRMTQQGCMWGARPLRGRYRPGYRVRGTASGVGRSVGFAGRMPGGSLTGAKWSWIAF